MTKSKNYQAGVRLIKRMQVRCKDGSEQRDRLDQLEKELKRIKGLKRSDHQQVFLVVRRMAEIMQEFILNDSESR
jgi:hypothetical protein